MSDGSMYPPVFVERGGSQEGTPPVIMNGARVAAFMLPAERQKLDLVLDRYINNPSGGRFVYRTVSPYVLLYFADFQTTYSGDFNDRDLGQFNELEVGFWQLAFDLESGSLDWFPSYVYTSVEVAVTEGREVYGWPKQMGDVHFPAWEHVVQDGLSLKVKTFESFGLGAKESVGDLVTITCQNESDHHISERFESGEHAVRSVASAVQQTMVTSTPSPPPSQIAYAPPVLGTGRVPGTGQPRRARTPRLRPIEQRERVRTSTIDGIGDEAFDLAAGLLAQQNNLLFLKQVRDAEYPHLAAYQAIVEAEAIVDVVRGGGFLSGDWQVAIEQSSGEPIVEELGLPTNPFTPKVAFAVNFDVRFDHGRPIWRAPGLR